MAIRGTGGRRIRRAPLTLELTLLAVVVLGSTGVPVREPSRRPSSQGLRDGDADVYRDAAEALDVRTRRERRLRLAVLERAEDQSRRALGRPLTSDELAAVVAQFSDDFDGV